MTTPGVAAPSHGCRPGLAEGWAADPWPHVRAHASTPSSRAWAQGRAQTPSAALC